MTFSAIIGIGIFSGTFVLTGNAATIPLEFSKNSHMAIERAVQTFEDEKDRNFIKLMDVGKRCIDKDETCRFYYRGYYYETPWWTAPEIY